jgi:hypothetical protein
MHCAHYTLYQDFLEGSCDGTPGVTDDYVPTAAAKAVDPFIDESGACADPDYPFSVADTMTLKGMIQGTFNTDPQMQNAFKHAVAYVTGGGIHGITITEVTEATSSSCNIAFTVAATSETNAEVVESKLKDLYAGNIVVFETFENKFIESCVGCVLPDGGISLDPSALSAEVTSLSQMAMEETSTTSTTTANTTSDAPAVDANATATATATDAVAPTTTDVNVTDAVAAALASGECDYCSQSFHALPLHHNL